MSSGTPTAIDLFAGAGGFSAGLQWAGFEILWAIDNSQAATQTYERNHPGVNCVTGDARECELPDLDRSVDLVAGGPPCPPFSVIGRSKLNSIEGRDATTDDRGQLWERLRDAVEKYEPGAFVMENVPGMASATNEVGESVLRHIQGEFRDLGFETQSQIVDAADFGVPQHRERLFILGLNADSRPPDLREWRSHREPRSKRERQARFVSYIERDSTQHTLGDYGFEINSKREEGQPESRVPWVTVAEAIADLPPLSPAGDREEASHPPSEATQYEIRAVTKYQSWARENPPEDPNSGQPRLYNHQARFHNLADLSIYSMLGEGTGWRISDLPDEIQPYRSDVFSDSYTKQRPDRPSSTITAHIHKDGHMHIHPHQARSFTVREAARIQSLPDRFVFPVSRTEAYRQVGNAVPPLIAEAIGQSLKARMGLTGVTE